MNAHAPVEAVAAIGHNGAPLTPYEACKVHMDDLLTEARNWADGVTVETQAQADEISRLIEDLRGAESAAEAARVTEKKPWDDGAAEVQDRYNIYIAPLKNKKPGKVPVAVDALKATLKPFLDAEKARLDKIAEDARQKAAAAAAEAAAALHAAQETDLASREAAEELVETARLAATAASRAEHAKPQARGGDRALGLRRTWTAELVTPREALVHYVTTRPDAVREWLQQLGDQDVREGKRTIPGFTVTEGTTL